VGREKISFCGDNNSVTTSGPDSSSSTTFDSGFGSSTAMFSRIFPTAARISFHSMTKSLNYGLSRCEYTEYEDLVRQTNLDS